MTTPSEREALAEALEVLEHATSFLSKKARDGHAKAVADLRAALTSAPDAAQVAELRARLQDPAAVHVAMLRGEIAKPDIRSMLHVYGEDVLARWDAAQAPHQEPAQSTKEK